MYVLSHNLARLHTVSYLESLSHKIVKNFNNIFFLLLFLMEICCEDLFFMTLRCGVIGQTSV